MYSAIQGSGLYQERLSKDIMLTLVKQYPAGQVVQAADILELDDLGSRPDRETMERILVPVMEKLKTRQIDYAANKESETEGLKQQDLSVAPAQKIDVLF